MAKEKVDAADAAAKAQADANAAAVQQAEAEAAARAKAEADASAAQQVEADAAAKAQADADAAAQQAEADAAAKVQANLPPVPQIFVRVIGPQQGRWRGGYGTPRHFTSDPVDIPFDDLSAEERAELQADPELQVAIIDLPH